MILFVYVRHSYPPVSWAEFTNMPASLEAMASVFFLWKVEMKFDVMMVTNFIGVLYRSLLYLHASNHKPLKRNSCPCGHVAAAAIPYSGPCCSPRDSLFAANLVHV